MTKQNICSDILFGHSQTGGDQKHIVGNLAPKSDGVGKNGVSGVLRFSLACSRRPHVKLNRRTERGHRTVAANMSIWIVDSDIGGSLDRALGFGSGHEETLLGLDRTGLRPLGALGPGSNRVREPWPSTRGVEIAKALKKNSAKALEHK